VGKIEDKLGRGALRIFFMKQVLEDTGIETYRKTSTITYLIFGL